MRPATPPILNSGPYGLSERLAEDVVTRVFQDIRSASMCWESVDKAGVFDSNDASGIAGRLCHFIADQLDASRDKLMDRINELERELDQARGTWRERPPLI